MGKLRFKITRTQVIAASWVVVFLVAMLALGMLAWWLQHRNEAGDFGAFSKTTEGALPSAVSDAQKQALAGDTSKAAQTIQNALNQPSVSNDEKQQLYVQQGVTYGNSGDHQKALEAYLAADAAKSDFTTAHLVAEEYEALGNTQKAIEYYKKTLTNLDPNAIDYKNDKQSYEDKVKALGGSL